MSSYTSYSTESESKLSVVSYGQQKKQGIMAPLLLCDLISHTGAERVLGVFGKALPEFYVDF